MHDDGKAPRGEVENLVVELSDVARNLPSREDDSDGDGTTGSAHRPSQGRASLILTLVSRAYRGRTLTFAGPILLIVFILTLFVQLQASPPRPTVGSNAGRTTNVPDDDATMSRYLERENPICPFGLEAPVDGTASPATVLRFETLHKKRQTLVDIPARIEFEEEAPVVDVDDGRIPPILLRVTLHEQVPPAMARAMDTVVRGVFRSYHKHKSVMWEVRTYSLASAREFILEKQGNSTKKRNNGKEVVQAHEVLAAFDALRPFEAKRQLFVWYYLYLNGGFYVDSRMLGAIATETAASPVSSNEGFSHLRDETHLFLDMISDSGFNKKARNGSSTTAQGKRQEGTILLSVRDREDLRLKTTADEELLSAFSNADSHGRVRLPPAELSSEFVGISPRHPVMSTILTEVAANVSPLASFQLKGQYRDDMLGGQFLPALLSGDHWLSRGVRSWLGLSAPTPGVDEVDDSLKLRLLFDVLLGGMHEEKDKAVISQRMLCAGQLSARKNLSHLHAVGGNLLSRDLHLISPNATRAHYPSQECLSLTARDRNIFAAALRKDASCLSGSVLFPVVAPAKASADWAPLMWTRYPTAAEDQWWYTDFIDSPESMWRKHVFLGADFCRDGLTRAMEINKANVDYVKGKSPKNWRRLYDIATHRQARDPASPSEGPVEPPSLPLFFDAELPEKDRISEYRVAPLAVVRNIPRKILQTNIGDRVPRGMRAAMQSIVDQNPNYEYFYYSDHRARAYIAHNYPHRVLKAFEDLKAGAFKSDLFRYCFLYREGGVYLDADMVALGSLDVLIGDNDTFVSAEDCGTGGVYNAFMASSPGHPVLRRSLELSLYRIERRIHGTDPLSVTGPGLLREAFGEVVIFNHLRSAENISTLRAEGEEYGLGIKLVRYKCNTDCAAGAVGLSRPALTTFAPSPRQSTTGSQQESASAESEGSTWQELPEKEEKDTDFLPVLETRYPTYKSESRWYVDSAEDYGALWHSGRIFKGYHYMDKDPLVSWTSDRNFIVLEVIAGAIVLFSCMASLAFECCCCVKCKTRSRVGRGLRASSPGRRGSSPLPAADQLHGRSPPRPSPPPSS